MIRVLCATYHILPIHLRLPFRYGIVTLHEMEHCFVRVKAVIDGTEVVGIAADNLAPKWFTKNPQTTIEQDVAEMKQVIATACANAERISQAQTVFEFWQKLYAEAQALSALPPLLSSFGVSLVERALIDAFCRAKGESFASAIRRNALGIRLGAIHPQLAGSEPGDWLPAQPLRRFVLRHTVGLLDPLTDDSLAHIADTEGAAELADDDLPRSLEACIRTYGLTHFKIKLCGDAARDLVRLCAVADVIQRHSLDYAFTLDGNEQFTTVEAFREAWQVITAAVALQEFLRHLLFVEQPLRRDVALDEATGEALLRWNERPPIIIDESDSELDSMRLALARGYAGASHKNCKGVFKGIANACLARVHSSNGALTGRDVILSAEDLTNIGPVALMQDLAVVATLGISHVERNGHHYFKGLSMFPSEVQACIVKAHGDLYHWHPSGFATLRVCNGAVDMGSIVDAPFGYSPDMDRLGRQHGLFGAT